MPPYTKNFFNNQKDGSVASARVVVPLVLNLVSPSSVVDIGCGVGTWLSVFREHGVSITGVDGAWIQPDQLQIPKEHFIAKDLANLDGIPLRADIAVCLEVAEHLPAGSAAGLVAALTSIAPVVLFSAAMPLQGGTQHVNEQWPSYWAAHFKKHGYVPVDCIRRHVWLDERIEYWYAQNTFIYVREDMLPHYPKLKKEMAADFGTALPLVHPKKFLYVAERYKLFEPFIKLLPGWLVRASKRILSAIRAPRSTHV